MTSIFSPEDPLAPPEPAFSEPWQAQALALAAGLVKEGHIAATTWAEALGVALKRAEASGLPDTPETYFTAVLDALDQVTEAQVGISTADRKERRAAWEAAYHRTPHGKPVEL